MTRSSHEDHFSVHKMKTLHCGELALVYLCYLNRTGDLTINSNANKLVSPVLLGLEHDVLLYRLEKCIVWTKKKNISAKTSSITTGNFTPEQVLGSLQFSPD